MASKLRNLKSLEKFKKKFGEVSFILKNAKFLLFHYFDRSIEVPTTFSVARAIVTKDGIGLNGLNKGLTATIGRNGVFNMIYFGFYHSVRDFIPAYQVNLR